MAAKGADARLILNGKSAQQPEVREAVMALRGAGFTIDVRVTWEGGDAASWAQEAAAAGIGRVIAGGGDGTVNEIVTGLMHLPKHQRPALGILPLGSANDFANGLTLPLEAYEALEMALQMSPRMVDVGCLDGDAFINMVSGGFGAEITTSTPVGLKRLLGGGAYSLMGMLKAWNYHPYQGHLRWQDGESSVPLFLLALGNGCQAGGGQRLAPLARLDDGLLEVLIVRHFSSLHEMKQVIDELENLPESGDFVHYIQSPWLEFASDSPFPLNLDGEPRHHRRFRAELEHQALPLLMPQSCPLMTPGHSLHSLVG
ncbi:lipid kinase YegS [Halomonas shantousis]